ncbi:MAG: histidine--tRNA ligase, partial [Epsilonproteobacteria bacterium]|nr:histidine--tRNA ligase [Campylobacterota bacterium]
SLVRLLQSENIDFEIDTNLVRGLDYYNKTAFEFISNEIGSQSAIAGGGRYDKLVEFLDGKPTPAVGFALGIERIMELVKMPEDKRDGYYIGAMDSEAIEKLFPLAHKKRATDKVMVEYSPKKLKAHLKGADRINARYCAVIGEDELQNKTIWVKDLVEKKETTTPWNEF